MSDPARTVPGWGHEGSWTELVVDLAKNAAHRVVIERDESLMDFDRRLLFQQVRATGADSLRYDLMRPQEEILLGLPDAFAWCWAKGGRWRAKVRSAVLGSKGKRATLRLATSRW